MPRKTQKKTAKRAENDWQTEMMRNGFYLLPSGQRSIKKGLLYGEQPLPAWADVEGQLLPQFIRDFPTPRPWGWWEEAAPEPRRRVGGSGELVEIEHRLARLEFGVPVPNTWWEGVNPDNPPVFESQGSYLQRHGLLTGPEKKWLAANPEALKPEKIKYLQQSPRHGF